MCVVFFLAMTRIHQATRSLKLRREGDLIVRWPVFNLTVNYQLDKKKHLKHYAFFLIAALQLLMDDESLMAFVGVLDSVDLDCIAFFAHF